ncbi:hypothetical protein ACS0TY_034446 [Phlomoides rotata]
MAAQQGFQAQNVNDEFNISQLIHDHQERAARLPPIEQVRTLLHHSARGFLSTLSQEHQGYPSGSMLDFACDAYGSPIIAVSNLAAHTKNLLANPKCSLLVAKDPEDRTDLIVTVQGDALPATGSNVDAIRTAYMTTHPDAFWVDFGGFQLLRIEPKVVRYVSGVATALLASGGLYTTTKMLLIFCKLSVRRNLPEKPKGRNFLLITCKNVEINILASLFQMYAI